MSIEKISGTGKLVLFCYKFVLKIIGTHGIEIDFEDKTNKRSYNATYLPHVATQFNWNQQQTLGSLIEKAGYKGKQDNISFTRLTTYRSSETKLSYSEYLNMRK